MYIYTVTIIFIIHVAIPADCSIQLSKQIRVIYKKISHPANNEDMVTNLGVSRQTGSLWH